MLNVNSSFGLCKLFVCFLYEGEKLILFVLLVMINLDYLENFLLII